MFVDETVIRVKAGRGGDGLCAFRREKYVPKGGPAGGDGGHGGSVILVATHRASTLLELARQVHLRAENGRPGGPKCMTGRSGRDLVIEVPLGTVVREVEPDVAPGRVLCDLTDEGQRFTAGRGGRGGRGNARFATATNQVPTECERGTPGEERRLALELKLIADVGLVDRPSAGKSTLISRLSAARPKIAAYPFTTLSPVPGIVDLGDHRSCVMADLPGLIAGAHQGAGLGTQFLRHIERTRMLVHVLDAAPLDRRPLAEAYDEIRRELVRYGAGLERKREVVALNKMDLPDAAENAAALREARPDLEVYEVSAVTGAGLQHLLGAVRRHLDALRAEEAAEREAAEAAPAPERPVAPPPDA